MPPKRRWNVIAVGVVLTCAVVFYLHVPARPPNLKSPIYKNKSKTDSKVKTYSPIADNFPLLAGVTSGHLPDVPSWNKPPSPHVPEKTPLFIGFTRNWPMLQQCVLSYLTAGWPPEDIYVIDNTGTMKSNFPPNPKLTLQNPFFLNVERLTEVFHVNVISTPTLLTFAQLQNFFIFTSMEHGWDYFWWSHMDVLAFAEERYDELEENKDKTYKSLYIRAVEKLREATSPRYRGGAEWGIQLFQYDWLALNNVKSFLKIGAWDPFISYYSTDCDMYGRFSMAGIEMPVASVGRVSDVTGSIDLNLLFRKTFDPNKPPETVEEMNNLPEDERGKDGYDKLIEAVRVQDDLKNHGEEERNSWQYKQTGGQGEPFYRDPAGFEWALQHTVAAGTDIYHEKWGLYNLILFLFLFLCVERTPKLPGKRLIN
jgi:hypothetical protein